MIPDQKLIRHAEPHEDDLAVQRIEVEFAIPVFLPQGFMRELDGLISSVVRMKMNQLEDHVHWVSGTGAKPSWSQADARFLGKAPADDAPVTGEPTFDNSVLHFETTCRQMHESERVKAAQKMEIETELHRILGSFGIASLSNRDGLAGLIGALISWAVRACKQSHQETPR